MQCLKPVKIPLREKEKEYRRSLPDSFPYDYRNATHIYVPCGKCEACQVKKRQQWFFRLKNEMEESLSSFFVTLTYSDDNIKYRFAGQEDGSMLPVACVEKKDVQKWLKRLRYDLDKISKDYPADIRRDQFGQLRYFLVSEYGPTTKRPHYHAILFNFPNVLKDKIGELLEATWGLGFITCSDVTDARINYLCSYCLSGNPHPQGTTPNFMLCSRKPGIGYNFLDKFERVRYLFDHETDMFPVLVGDKVLKLKLPRYYRDKLFDQPLKDKITLEALNEHTKEARKREDDQKRWLLKNGYPVNEVTMSCPYAGSPLSLHLEAQTYFRKHVQSKTKDRKL